MGFGPPWDETGIRPGGLLYRRECESARGLECESARVRTGLRFNNGEFGSLARTACLVGVSGLGWGL